MIRRHRAAFIILFITIFVYVLSWKCQRAVDYYRLHIFPLGTNTLARVLSVIPFSVGEILIIAAVFFSADQFYHNHSKTSIPKQIPKILPYLQKNI